MKKEFDSLLSQESLDNFRRGLKPQKQILDYEEFDEPSALKRSDSLAFLKDEKKVESIFDKKYWSLYDNDRPLESLKFSNGKNAGRLS